MRTGMSFSLAMPLSVLSLLALSTPAVLCAAAAPNRQARCGLRPSITAA